MDVGSGVVSERTGILLGNRGAALAIDPDLGPVLRPGRRPPLRSLPALLVSRGGQVAALGAAGPEAATAVTQVASRLMLGLRPAEAVEAPRFALGATPDGRDAAVLVEEEREPAPASRLRSVAHLLSPVDGSPWRTAGTIVRGDTGRIAPASDDGEGAGL